LSPDYTEALTCVKQLFHSCVSFAYFILKSINFHAKS